MTKATDRALRRLVTNRDGTAAYVIDVRGTSVSIRPKGSRDPKVRVLIGWEQLYLRLLDAAVAARRKGGRRG